MSAPSFHFPVIQQMNWSFIYSPLPSLPGAKSPANWGKTQKNNSKHSPEPSETTLSRGRTLSPLWIWRTHHFVHVSINNKTRISHFHFKECNNALYSDILYCFHRGNELPSKLEGSSVQRQEGREKSHQENGLAPALPSCRGCNIVSNITNSTNHPS